MFLNKKITKLLTLLAMISVVFIASCQEGPPKEEGEFRESELVELIKLDSTFKFDIRYATSNNLVGRQSILKPGLFCNDRQQKL